VTGKCDLPADNAGHDIAVFKSLEDCQRFGSASAREPPSADGRWTLDANHYYQCFALTPMPLAAPTPPASAPPVNAPPVSAPPVSAPPVSAPPAGASPAGAGGAGPSRTVYKTTAEALQSDFGADPDALTQKIGGAIIEISGTVDNTATTAGTALQLSAHRWDVAAWLTPDAVPTARQIRRRQHVTLRCDRIGTLVAASARRPAVVEVRDCSPVNPGK
jgi:hypothetical protein